MGELGLNPYNWSTHVIPSQHAVMHFDVATRCRCAPNGVHLTRQNDVVLLFDTLDAAERYCASQVPSNPRVGILLYSASGTLIRTYEDPQLADYHHGLPSAKRSIVWAVVILIAALGATIWDWWTDWSLMLGVIIATKLVTVAVLQLADGVGGALNHWRAQRLQRK